LRFVDITLLIASSLFGLFLAVYVAWRRNGPGAQALSILILGASVWSLGYAFEIVASSLAIKMFWERVEYIGIIVVPLAWFTFVAQYLGYPGWMKGVLRQKVLLAIIPAITLVLVWTNPWHQLMWKGVTLQTLGPLQMLDFVHGPWFWVFIVFSYSLLVVASVQLASSLFNIVRLQRWQVSLTLLAILFPWAGNLTYLAGWSPVHFMDLTAFLFLISGVLFSVSLFRYKLANILPIAQKAVFAGLSDCVFVLDLNDCIVDMNMAAQSVSNCSGKESLGKSIAQVMPELSKHIQAAGLTKDYQAEITQAMGEETQIFDLHISLLPDSYDNPIGRIVVLHQITHLKRNQAELEQARNRLETVVSRRTDELKRAIERLQQELAQRTLAEKRFKDVIESAPDAMFLLDQSGKILLVNGMAERLFGYQREELVGKNIAGSLIPEQLHERQYQYFREILETPANNQSSFGTDLYGKRKDGSEFPLEVDLSRLDASEGFWVAINVRDISERKHIESALRESERTYRALFENAGDAIFLADLNGNIRQVNHKAVALLGFSQQELGSLSVLDITIPEEFQEVRENIAKLSQGERLAPFIRHYFTKWGKVVPTENNAVLVRDAEGTPKFIQNIARDITERIKAELEQRQLMEQISRSNEEMRDLALRLQEVQERERQELASVLHDRVGQYLTGLNLNLKILQNQLQAEANSELQKRLSDSLQMVEETTHQIRDVMADLNPPVLDEYGLIPAIKWYCSDFTNHSGIATNVNGGKFEKRLSPSVEKILFRLVQESLNNVAKHAQASKVDIEIASRNESLVVTVKDDGAGFDPNENDGRQQEPHWGLLSMQRRAASIGADLQIHSTPGIGTEVSIKVRRKQNDH
jgi:PAS domain S-box-containing protein